MKNSAILNINLFRHRVFGYLWLILGQSNGPLEVYKFNIPFGMLTSASSCEIKINERRYRVHFKFIEHIFFCLLWNSKTFSYHYFKYFIKLLLLSLSYKHNMRQDKSDRTGLIIWRRKNTSIRSIYFRYLIFIIKNKQTYQQGPIFPHL